ncbi:MAG: cytochrome c3 family protein [Desulfuromonas sp.]|nr:cytochrome c3 family protein [Desulfuromonas sp.]
METTQPTRSTKHTIFLALAIVSVSLIFSATIFAADTYQYTGKGTVTFNHAKHGAELGCASCHQEETPAKITIENKKQGHDLCLTCHKAQAKQGNKSAPTKCSACHVK